mmetsp:Transcript_89982/g.140972  ORF Transcript_89982/g.140972 Transcript_89982/m.140972 type:complete len:221 (-) Transcript_89982:106-768(-)
MDGAALPAPRRAVEQYASVSTVGEPCKLMKHRGQRALLAHARIERSNPKAAALKVRQPLVAELLAASAIPLYDPPSLRVGGKSRRGSALKLARLDAGINADCMLSAESNLLLLVGICSIVPTNLSLLLPSSCFVSPDSRLGVPRKEWTCSCNSELRASSSCISCCVLMISSVCRNCSALRGLCLYSKTAITDKDHASRKALHLNIELQPAILPHRLANLW